MPSRAQPNPTPASAGPLRLTRRAAVAGMAAGAAGFVLFGPRGRTGVPSGRLVLEYWEKWTGHEARAMLKVVDEFNTTVGAAKGIFVRYLTQSSIDQKAFVAIAGGNPPDVLGLWNYNVPMLAESGAIHALDDLAPAHGIALGNYAAGLRPIMTHAGKLWATIHTGGNLALYYNRGLFREVGLDPERPPRTISELDRYARKLDAIEPDGRIRRAGFLHTVPGWWSWIWGYSFGGTIYDPERDASTVASTENIRAFEWVQATPRALGSAAVERFRAGLGEYAEPRNPFLTGEVGMVMQGPWLANIIKEFKPGLDYGVAPFPALDGLEGEPIGLIDTDILVIPRGAKDPEASMEFVAYTQRQDVTEFLATVHCKNSPLARSSPEFIANHPNRGVLAHDAIAKSSRAFLCPRTRQWPEIKRLLDAAADRVWKLEETPGAILGQAEAQTQNSLDRAAVQRRRRGRA